MRIGAAASRRLQRAKTGTLDSSYAMAPGLEIRVVDVDDDYLGINIAASSERFFGSARIYAGLTQLSEFAGAIAGFPSSANDRRLYEFGTRDPGYAGGFVQLAFHCQDGAGHAAVTVAIEDDAQLHAKASATFSFPFEAAELDRFLATLRKLERTKDGHATLVAAV